jgi:hypothetical protein
MKPLFTIILFLYSNHLLAYPEEKYNEYVRNREYVYNPHSLKGTFNPEAINKMDEGASFRLIFNPNKERNKTTKLRLECLICDISKISKDDFLKTCKLEVESAYLLLTKTPLIETIKKEIYFYPHQSSVPNHGDNILISSGLGPGLRSVRIVRVIPFCNGQKGHYLEVEYDLN